MKVNACAFYSIALPVLIAVVSTIFYHLYNDLVAPAFNWSRASWFQIIAGWVVLTVVSSFFRSDKSK